MPRSRLVVILVAAIVLLPAVFVLSRRAAGADSSPAAPVNEAAPARPPGAPEVKPATPSKASRPPQATRARKATKADRFAAAVRRNQTVVLLLSDGRGADASATARAVRGVKARAPRTRVFTDNLKHLSGYRAVLGSLGVSQSPSVVIVGRGGEARVVEGYVDPETLLQQVLDARR